MPSPLGHAMAGAMIAWIAEMRDGPAPEPRPEPASSFVNRFGAVLTPLAVTSAVLAVSPDFDVFFHTHRTYSHSLGAAAIVWLLVALVAWRLRLPVVKVATICAAAYASHVLLDWLGRNDSAAGGLMALWPLSTDYYRSGLNLFLEIAGHPRGMIGDPAAGLVRLIVANAYVLLREMVILGPPFLLVMTLRMTRGEASLLEARRPHR